MFAIQARIDCYDCVERKRLKELAALAQAFREYHGNIHMRKALCLICTIVKAGICKHGGLVANCKCRGCDNV